MGLKTGDSDVYLFGPSAVEYENELRIKRNAEATRGCCEKDDGEYGRAAERAFLCVARLILPTASGLRVST